MSTVNVNYPTLIDLAAMPESKDVQDIINLLAQFNPILEDAPTFPCNKGLSHETTVRTGLPSVAWGRLYKGIPQSKGSKQMITDTTGFVESASVVDARLVDVFEKQKIKLQLEWMKQNHILRQCLKK